jgi:hypothetical protein
MIFDFGSDVEQLVIEGRLACAMAPAEWRLRHYQLTRQALFAKNLR